MPQIYVSGALKKNAQVRIATSHCQWLPGTRRTHEDIFDKRKTHSPYGYCKSACTGKLLEFRTNLHKYHDERDQNLCLEGSKDNNQYKPIELKYASSITYTGVCRSSSTFPKLTNWINYFPLCRRKFTTGKRTHEEVMDSLSVEKGGGKVQGPVWYDYDQLGYDNVQHRRCARLHKKSDLGNREFD